MRPPKQRQAALLPSWSGPSAGTRPTRPARPAPQKGARFNKNNEKSIYNRDVDTESKLIEALQPDNSIEGVIHFQGFRRDPRGVTRNAARNCAKNLTLKNSEYILNKSILRRVTFIEWARQGSIFFLRAVICTLS